MSEALPNDALPAVTAVVVLAEVVAAWVMVTPLNRPDTAAATIRVFIEYFMLVIPPCICRSRTMRSRARRETCVYCIRVQQRR
uniref:Uncharacterized protein n=1 Tax=Paracidobacterium acidisoli TaxID=2303751 RepID=A0A372IU71_9BACT